MFGGYGPHLASQLCAADGVDLVGVDAGQQAVRLARLQHPAGLGHIEYARLAEHVAVAGQLLLRHSGQHGIDQVIHIAVAVVLVFFGHRVGAQEGGAHVHGVGLAQGLDHPQLLQLGLQVQAIAAFDLAGRHAHGQHLIQEGAGFGGEGPFALLAGVLHRAQDATAHAQDVQVAGPGQLQGDLMLAPAAEHQVGVGVHQDRRHQPAARVDDRGARSGALGQAVLRAAVGDYALLQQDAGVFYFADFRLPGACVGMAAQGGAQQADIFDQCFFHVWAALTGCGFPAPAC